MSSLEAMTAAATAAAMRQLVKGEVRTTDPGNHYRATQQGEPPATQLHLVCGLPACGQSVCCLSNDLTAGAYLYPLEQIVTSVAAHVLQCHAGAVTSQPAQT